MPMLPFRRWLAGLAALLLALPVIAADVELPPVDEVFVLSAQATAPDRIEVRWQIADGYYLYRHRTSVKADAAFAAAKLALPTGRKYRDEFFGDVETYRKELLGTLTGTPAAGAASTILTIKYQGCADAGVCYPPQTRTLKVTLPIDAGDAGSFGLAKKGGGLFGFGNADAGVVDAAPLPPEQAFTSEVIALDGNTLLLRLTPAKGYYLSRDTLSARLDAGKGVTASLPPASKLPKAQPYRDEHFGNVAVYFDQVEITLPVTRTVTDAAKGTLLLGLQGCQTDGICYPPMTRRLAVSLPAGTLTPAAVAEPTADDAAAMPIADAGVATEAATIAGTATTAATEIEAAASTDDTARTPPPQQQTRGLLGSLLLALLGGLILNLMPCVLPVLSLKALALVQGGASPQRARTHALAYTAGVLISFAALGALALALRKAGLALGWGFQLQQPLVVAVLALVVFGFGLSLSGLWYASIGIGRHGASLMQRDGIGGDVATGVLAVVLATPCTAPFMGAALAYAFTGPAPGGMLVFLMLGLGLALPFLLIGFVPAFARLLPKPGAWMETLKQVLACPMYLTAVWLVWVLGKQRGVDAIGLVLAGSVVLALGLWWLERGRFKGSMVTRVLAIGVLLAALVPVWMVTRLETPVAMAKADESVAYSSQKLADLRGEGRTVFINMTADWCVTCKANEKAVLGTDHFRSLLSASNAVYMKGDWTNVDPQITAFLQQHGAVGVPLYVVYHGEKEPAQVLPTVLTAAIVEAALVQ